MTVALDDEAARDYISNWMFNGPDQIHGYEVSTTRGGRFYAYSKIITFDSLNECSVLVELDPRARYPRRDIQESGDVEAEPDVDVCAIADRRRPFRIEFNPARLRENPEHQAAFLAIMRQWFGDALHAEMRSANITRVDLATDVNGININRLVVRRLNNTVASTNYGRDGSIQTMYLGAKNSGLRFVVYDKRAQRRGRVVTDRFQRGCTRIEVRIKAGLSLSGLRSYPNPFSSLGVREIESMEVVGRMSCSHYWDWLVAASKVDGLEASLNRIRNPKTRRVWRQRFLDRESPDWWCPEDLWSGLRKAISDVGLFPSTRRIRYIQE